MWFRYFYFYIVDQDVSFVYYWKTIHFAPIQCMLKTYLKYMISIYLGHGDQDEGFGLSISMSYVKVLDHLLRLQSTTTP